MSRGITLRHQFVEHIPSELEDGTVYVSILFATAAHKCCCGCDGLVITPLTPTDWTLIFDGETISLSPSIGNWSFECRSHYWVKRNKVEWSKNWSREEIQAGRARDVVKKKRYYDTTSSHGHTAEQPKTPLAKKARTGFWRKLASWFK